jgi:RimJ/RimL family protein N-acetyltransferase
VIGRNRFACADDGMSAHDRFRTGSPHRPACLGSAGTLRDVQRDIVLTTPRLVLTSWLPDDVDVLFEIHSDPETMKLVRYGRPESRVETEQLVNAYIAEQAARGWTKWRLSDTDGGLIGRAGFRRPPHWSPADFHDPTKPLGPRTCHGDRRSPRGLASVPCTAVPLRALAAVGNDPSVRVLEKVGVDELGTEDFGGTICRSFVYPRTDEPSHSSAWP